jgi:preprotein translocase subunit SecG
MITVAVIFLITMMVFAYMKNKQENRRIERRERLREKQEELIESLKKDKEE